jgi:hypothetical protein
MIRIPYHEKRFFKRTISGYSKEKVLNFMKDSIHNNHKTLALYCCIELFCSGFYEEIFYELFIIMVKYCHMQCPILPKYYLYAYEYYQSAKKELQNEIIELRNDPKFRQYMEVLIILLCSSNKQFILPKQYQKYFHPIEIINKEEIEEVLVKFKKTLWKLDKLESFNKTKQIQEKLMLYLGFILNGSDDDKEHLWNIVLEFAKYIPQKYILDQIGFMYQIYSNVVYGEKIFLLLFSIMFFFRGTFYKIKHFKEPQMIHHKFYENIRNSMLSHSRRVDFINFQKPIRPQMYKLKQSQIRYQSSTKHLSHNVHLKLPIHEEQVQEESQSEKDLPNDQQITPEEIHEPQEENTEELVEELNKDQLQENTKDEDDDEYVTITINNRFRESRPKEIVRVSCIDKEEQENGDEITFW